MAGLGFGIGGPPVKEDVEGRALLHTCIHNYFVNQGQGDIAKAVLDSGIPIDKRKLSSDSKSAGRPNGADDAGDSKDDVKNDAGSPGDNFLLDYWGIFWDLWNAAKDSSKNTVASQYLNFNQQRNQIRQQAGFPPQMMAGALGHGFPRMGAAPNMANLQHKAINNSAAQRTMNPQQFQQRVPLMNQQQPMQRDGSDMDAAQRAQSPNSNGDGAGGSPAKRPRTDGAFNQHMMGPRGPMPGQVPNGAVGNPEAMMLQNSKQNALQGMMAPGKDPHALYARNLVNQQTQQSVSMANFGPNGPFNGAGVQMSPPIMDPQFDLNMMANNGRMVGNPAAAGNSNGGALADYQMQLMLLEQQNKKRLMIAQHEREAQGNPSLPGQPGYGTNNNSPHGRNGQSPANDAKRKSPGAQGSPMPDGSMPNRSSPGVGNFDPNQPNLNSHFIPQMSKMMGESVMGGPGSAMRPPSSHPNANVAQMEMMRNGGRLPPNMNWPGGVPMGGAIGNPSGPGGQPNAGENQMQRSAMPPPSVPANSNKPQPSPTPQNAAPPTPSGGAKAPPKKKDTKDTKKKPKKGQSGTSTAANAETDRQPTPTPATPATPVAPESHVIKGLPNQNQPQQQAANGQIQQPPSSDLHINPNLSGGIGMEPFGAANDFTTFNFEDSIGGEENTDLLNDFDFESFMGDGSNMDWNAGFSMDDPLESGAGR